MDVQYIYLLKTKLSIDKMKMFLKSAEPNNPISNAFYNIRMVLSLFIIRLVPIMFIMNVKLLTYLNKNIFKLENMVMNILKVIILR